MTVHVQQGRGDGHPPHDRTPLNLDLLSDDGMYFFYQGILSHIFQESSEPFCIVKGRLQFYLHPKDTKQLLSRLSWKLNSPSLQEVRLKISSLKEYTQSEVRAQMKHTLHASVLLSACLPFVLLQRFCCLWLLLHSDSVRENSDSVC